MKTKNKKTIRKNGAMIRISVFVVGVFVFTILGYTVAMAETYDQCLISCKNGGKSIDVCKSDCANLNDRTTFNGTEANLPPGVLPGDTRLHDYPTNQPSTTTVGGPKKFNYTLLESFPGFFTAGDQMTDLPALILAIYKFGIWTVGIAGLFMLVVGGFMYMASAGNTSTASNARNIIWDSLLGIAAALGAYLILYVINPDLTRISINFTPVNVIETTGIGEGGGSCEVLQDGPCSVANLRNTCFGSNAEAASKVCNYESGGNIGSPSKTDIGADKNIFSWGLFQINLTQHSLGGFNCEAAYNGKNYNSIVINQAMYNNCKLAATTAMTNINYACKISNNGRNWQPWLNTKKACGL